MKKWLWILLVAVVVVIAVLAFTRDGGQALKDGTYNARTETDSHGYYSEIEITIDGGKITDVDYKEVNEETGQPKGEEYQYQQSIEAANEYEKRLIETQDPDKVDKISGATSTWNTFKKAAKEALEKAK